jgi:hypothetical protein
LLRNLYDSPTGAAVSITKYPVEGWNFWKFERAPGDWVRLNELRRSPFAQSSSPALSVVALRKAHRSELLYVQFNHIVGPSNQ